MSIWNHIVEFLLFQWLFGLRNINHNVSNSHPVDTTDSPRRVDIENYIANALDDDLRDKRGSDYGRYHNLNDYSNYGGGQSHDDFLDEQDDYDMMDDDF